MFNTAGQPFNKPSPAEIRQRADLLRRKGAPCRWCPRCCGVNRLADEIGQCGAGAAVLVASTGLHFGEESHFVGRGGSGTIFLACCNLGCLFCQNYDISHGRDGQPVDAVQLARCILSLQDQGAENINFVTPSHYPADILEALSLACELGLKVPVVWNSSGYDSVETLATFDGVVDVYMPDFKFGDDDLGAELTSVADYTSTARQALAEMVRQVGPGLSLSGGAARCGISVRHLVLPGHYDDSRACLDILHSISPEITVNVMSQYHPSYKAWELPGLNRRIDWQEYRAVVQYGRDVGLYNVLEQA